MAVSFCCDRAESAIAHSSPVCSLYRHIIIKYKFTKISYQTLLYSNPSEYKQPMKSSICHTFIGFKRCTKIPINTDLLRVHRSVRPSLYPFYSQNCLHILARTSEVLRNIRLKKWGQSDVDPKEFKRITRTSSISKFQTYHKHQVL